MIFCTLQIDVHKQRGADVYGQPSFDTPYKEKVAPVKLAFTNQHTTVRTDSAASHGHASETVADVVILVIRTSKIELDDKLVIMGNPVRVIEKRPRHTASGYLSHYQLKCIAWVS